MSRNTNQLHCGDYYMLCCEADFYVILKPDTKLQRRASDNSVYVIPQDRITKEPSIPGAALLFYSCLKPILLSAQKKPILNTSNIIRSDNKEQIVFDSTLFNSTLVRLRLALIHLPYKSRFRR